MGIPNKGEFEGMAEQAKGRIKEAAGAVTDDEELKNEGRVDQATGEIREGAHRARRKVGETIERIGDEIKR